MANKKRAASAKNKKSIINDDSLSGFTIIEVVLVLAIAGLIFMMVFIALPQLQRAQRDTQRRNNLSSFQSAITQYQANNNGKIPNQDGKSEITCSSETADGLFAALGGSSIGLFQTPKAFAAEEGSGSTNLACRLIKVYMNGANATENSFVDPDGTAYAVKLMTIPTGEVTIDEFDHTVYFYPKAKCDGESVIAASNPRDFAIQYKLEGSGTYCSDNNG